MKKVLVSGCYDILHAGHIQFFEDAKKYGDHLIVCFASNSVLKKHKGRSSSLPEKHKKIILESLEMVDQAVIGTNEQLGLDFRDHLIRMRPDILISTTDDKYSDLKRGLCKELGIEFKQIAKTPINPPISTSEIIEKIKRPFEVPLRVDFAGGWLDVPRFSREDGFIVNCAISPLVSLGNWSYKKRSGVGGSGAWAILNGEEGVKKEIDAGVGWQDPAIIRETGLCVWKSGPVPKLWLKKSGEMLKGLMALYWTGEEHNTPDIANKKRDYERIVLASKSAARAILDEDLHYIGNSMNMTYRTQLEEGMKELPELSPNQGVRAMKYCGSGWGGYAFYLFYSQDNRDEFARKEKRAIKVEPYLGGYC
jgi:cytidyltransferase-like protein